MTDNEIVREQVRVSQKNDLEFAITFKGIFDEKYESGTTKAWLALQDVLGLHSDFKIYGECECAERGEEGHLLSDPEWSEFAFCAKSFMYLICHECCTDGEDTEMTEWCADHHDHGEGKPICNTRQAINNRLGGTND